MLDKEPGRTVRSLEEVNEDKKYTPEEQQQAQDEIDRIKETLADTLPKVKGLPDEAE